MLCGWIEGLLSGRTAVWLIVAPFFWLSFILEVTCHASSGESRKMCHCWWLCLRQTELLADHVRCIKCVMSLS